MVLAQKCAHCVLVVRPGCAFGVRFGGLVTMAISGYGLLPCALGRNDSTADQLQQVRRRHMLFQTTRVSADRSIPQAAQHIRHLATWVCWWHGTDDHHLRCRSRMALGMRLLEQLRAPRRQIIRR